MANISVSLPSDGETIDVSDYNTPINTIVNDYNGNIDNSNIAAAAAIAGTKIADDGITASKIDWASTGANGGIWWEELGRTTLSGTADTITVNSLPARKYLYIIVTALNSGALDLYLRFNNDSATNYAQRVSTNGGADTSGTSLDAIPVIGGSYPSFTTMTVINISNQEKTLYMQGLVQNTAGAANIPGRIERSAKWANTSAAISRVDIINSGAGDLASGSEVVILGHN